jgi:hypothetical protein
MPRKNEWASRFGAKRKEIDRRILAEVERQIAAEEAAALQHKADSAHAQWLEDEDRERIARAFGRPLN